MFKLNPFLPNVELSIQRVEGTSDLHRNLTGSSPGLSHRLSGFKDGTNETLVVRHAGTSKYLPDRIEHFTRDDEHTIELRGTPISTDRRIIAEIQCVERLP